MRIEANLKKLGLTLPDEMRTPPGFEAKWTQVRIIGTRIYCRSRTARNRWLICASSGKSRGRLDVGARAARCGQRGIGSAQ